MVEKNDVKVIKGLGETLRTAREKENLTQVEVATKVGMDVNYYARIERGLGNPSYVKLHKIMKVLHIKTLNVE
jgi:transcriptional regulator with XRE-family HTH domain